MPPVVAADQLAGVATTVHVAAEDPASSHEGATAQSACEQQSMNPIQLKTPAERNAGSAQQCAAVLQCHAAPTRRVFG